MQTVRLRRNHRRGFTLTDVCVVLGIVLMILAMLPAIVQRAGSESFKSNCASNLKNIAAALITYANDHNGVYPRTRFDPENPSPTVWTGRNATDPFAADGPSPNDTSAAIYFLLRSSGMSPRLFVCPASSGEAYDPPRGQTIASHANFPSPQNLSYSMQNPYPSAKATADGFKWDGTLSTDFAIAADLNPGSAALATTPESASTANMQPCNSPNHKFKGQNVLYGDYHVAWQASPFCGEPRTVAGVPHNDNIYTSQTSPPAVGGTPQDVHDSVLLPTATEGFKQYVTTYQDARRANWIAGFIIFGTIVLVLVIAAMIDRARRRQRSQVD